MAKCIVITILFACTLATSAVAGELPYGADAYAGGFVGYSASGVASPAAKDVNGTAYQREDIRPGSFFGGAYAGIGYSALAAEAGVLRLPNYHSSVDGAAPARNGNQSIGGSVAFARAVLRVPPQWGWYAQPYVFGGGAHVKAASREVVHCGCYPGGEADFSAPLEHHGLRPYYGVGAEVPLYGPISARAEVGFIRGAVQSFWTSNRNYTLGSVALQVRF